MTRSLLAFLLVFLVCLPVGCGCVEEAAEATAMTAAAGNDRYTELAMQALDGTVDPSMGIAPVSSEDLAATPSSMKTLANRLLEALHTNRHAWHSMLFQLGLGPDPSGMNLEPLQLPGAEQDENDALLEGGDR